MREIHSILSVKEVINFTDQEIWVYGTSGELVKIPRHNSNESLDPNVYYIVPDKARDEILAESHIDKSHLLKAEYIGRGREDTPIYHLKNSSRIMIIPITEQISTVINRKLGLLIQPA